MAYDSGNIFAKILRAEIPANKIYEDEFALAFYDIDPKAPVHALVIPKGDYQDWLAFTEQADPAFVQGFAKAVSATARKLGLDRSGYRMIVNNGEDGGQEVPHLHIHLLGGGKLGGLAGA